MESRPFASALPFPFLDSCCEYIRGLRLSWNTYYEQGLISADEMSVLDDLSDRSRWGEYFHKDPKLYTLMTMKVLKALTEREVVIFVMMLMEDIIMDYQEQVGPTLQDSPDLITVLERLLRSSDEYISTEAVRLLFIIDRLVGFSCCTIPVLNWIQAGLQAHGDRESRCNSATFFLQYFLQLKQFRLVFFENTDCMNHLIDVARGRGVQLQYQALFCLWIMTFDKAIVGALQSRYEIIPVMLELARSAVKEKIVRVCLACWANFIHKARRIAIPVMIGCKVLDFVEHLFSRKVADAEMHADMQFIKDELGKAFQSLNSFDEYASEIKSGNLHWSPPHKSSIFWSDNAARLEEGEGELLRLLTRLLTHSQDPLVLAVAANDLGEYMSRRPQGRKLIESLGTKQQLMHLMAHQNPDVRFMALNSVQKYMANLWYIRMTVSGSNLLIFPRTT